MHQLLTPSFLNILRAFILPSQFFHLRLLTMKRFTVKLISVALISLDQSWQVQYALLDCDCS